MGGGNFLWGGGSVCLGGEEGVEAGEVLFVGLCAEGAEFGGDFGGFELLCPGEVRAVAGGGEGHGESEPGLDNVFDHDARVRFEFLKETFVGVVDPVRAVHGEDPFASGFEFELREGIRKSVGSPPLREENGVFEGGEDFLWEDGEEACGAHDRIGVASGSGRHGGFLSELCGRASEF